MLQSKQSTSTYPISVLINSDTCTLYD